MMLEGRKIGVGLGGKTILDGVAFAAEAGAFTAIVGPNGSGKTTLMRAMTGEIRCTGEVLLNGLNIHTARPWELATVRGVLPQATVLAFPFTVTEVVRMGLEAGPHAADATLLMSALEAVDLAGYGNRLFQELSGGEQQRVQLARVLAQVWEPRIESGPCWLFLDEPVASLDIAHQLGVMQLARDYARRGGGVVAVMHDLNLTAMYADRVTLMRGGRVAATGSVDAVLTDTHLSNAYGCRLKVNTRPPDGQTFVLPHAARQDQAP